MSEAGSYYKSFGSDRVLGKAEIASAQPDDASNSVSGAFCRDPHSARLPRDRRRHDVRLEDSPHG